MAEPAAPELWRALVDVYQPVLREVVTELERDAGIDSGAYSVLAYLDRAGGAMPLAELQSLMRVRYSQPGLSRLVQRMEADGLVTRVAIPRTAGPRRCALTRAGRARTRGRARRLRAGARTTTSARTSTVPTPVGSSPCSSASPPPAPGLTEGPLRAPVGRLAATPGPDRASRPPCPCHSPESEPTGPPDTAEAQHIARGILSASSGPDGPTDLQRVLVESIAHSMTGYGRHRPGRGDRTA